MGGGVNFSDNIYIIADIVMAVIFLRYFDSIYCDC